MKKNRIGYYIFSTLLLASIIMFRNKYLYISFWIILTIGLIFKLGFPRDKNYYRNNVIRIILILLFSYFLITYSAGIILGFSRNVFNLKFIKILDNISSPLIYIITTEIIRYIYAKNSQSDKMPLIYLTIIYVFLDIVMEFSINYFDNFELLFIFICLVLLPRIACNSLYSYLSYKTGYLPPMIMRIILELYIYFVPIFPNLGNYLSSVLGVLCPVIVYMLTSRVINLYDKNNKYLVTIRRNYIFIPLVVIAGVVIFLVSGIGKYRMVAIASGSMEPEFYRGDAVIYEKFSNIENIQIGDILAYEKNNVLVTHRVVGMGYEKGKYTFITKGDNNDNVDSYMIIEDEVRGIVSYKVSYIGMPTVWIQELFDKI